MNTSSLTSKGQVTIPSALREKFLLQPGDKVLFEVIDDNLVIKPLKKGIDSLAGCFADDIGDRTATLEDMEQAIQAGYTDSLQSDSPQQKSGTRNDRD
ncbi:AbrB/MazE/SpoVT family DNA-binding domain-containing protein [Endozoicomonas gorgoniicola]|uniref:AbrB/MazE/SpoVT family DNA-binding domain-containing protein n=1 Tax=Endozoicomonas gorgoniicola TaxID=1234144 RepID=A0ABT3MUZ0_9GAMM|nr:AbrB/MazE/SpoVT family DNA-binding domain-containing protein [Endozoicomonas gorgoniicola]MCW7553195.1 AbrB/MazE/SpoVT family DNA-binding domain-containing protein [Endozoicomonas gorgoniicola]